ncbi:MAG: hypothetical protein IJ287_05180 [Methanobrevibacter sp.]|nr:hypothetical protein [Methanobrevibacter sp.]
MANDKNKRTIVYIDNDDFDFYQELKKSHYFNDNSFKNIDIFLVAALVGFVIEGKPLSLDNAKKKKDYFRVNDNKNKDSMVILKSLAISKFDDVNVLSNEDKLFSLCEDYANSGIKRIYAWYNSDEDTFDNILTKELLKCWKNLDFEKLN